jgi:desulfoferrodoxin (superoxide reductase-like protein)
MTTAVERVALEMKIPVSVADVWTNAFSTEKHTPVITAEDSLEYAVAAGLALPYINC